MRIGYYRCSSDEQHPDRQIKILEKMGCKKIYSDMLSGKDRNRPGLEQMLDFVRSEDIVCCESISRISRSTRDFLNIMDELKEKEVLFVSQKENIDTSTPQGQFMLTVFAALSDLERSQIRQRQAEGIAIAKEKGVFKGRQPKPFDNYLFDQLYRQWKNGDITQSCMIKRLNVCRSTLYKKIKKYEKERKGAMNDAKWKSTQEK